MTDQESLTLRALVADLRRMANDAGFCADGAARRGDRVAYQCERIRQRALRDAASMLISTVGDLETRAYAADVKPWA